MVLEVDGLPGIRPDAGRDEHHPGQVRAPGGGVCSLARTGQSSRRVEQDGVAIEHRRAVIGDGRRLGVRVDRKEGRRELVALAGVRRGPVRKAAPSPRGKAPPSSDWGARFVIELDHRRASLVAARDRVCGPDPAPAARCRARSAAAWSGTHPCLHGNPGSCSTSGASPARSRDASARGCGAAPPLVARRVSGAWLATRRARASARSSSAARSSTTSLRKPAAVGSSASADGR